MQAIKVSVLRFRDFGVGYDSKTSCFSDWRWCYLGKGLLDMASLHIGGHRVNRSTGLENSQRKASMCSWVLLDFVATERTSLPLYTTVLGNVMLKYYLFFRCVWRICHGLITKCCGGSTDCSLVANQATSSPFILTPTSSVLTLKAEKIDASSCSRIYQRFTLPAH